MPNRPKSSVRRVDVFDSTRQKTNLWLKDVESVMRTGDRVKAYAALRAVLHALRECLPVEETAKFAAQMPLLVTGVFFDGWKPRRKPLRLTKADFYRELRECLRGELDPGLAARGVFCAIERHVSPGEIASVQRVLPSEVRALWREIASQGRGSEESEPVEAQSATGIETTDVTGFDRTPDVSTAWQPGWAARQYGERSGGVTDVGGPWV